MVTQKQEILFETENKVHMKGHAVESRGETRYEGTEMSKKKKKKDEQVVAVCNTFRGENHQGSNI